MKAQRDNSDNTSRPVEVSWASIGIATSAVVAVLSITWGFLWIVSKILSWLFVSR